MVNYGLYILPGMLIVAAIGIGAIRVLLCIVTVSGSSMSPTLHSRDRVLVLRHWPTKWLQKGQIVIGDLGQVLTAFEQILLEARAKPNTVQLRTDQTSEVSKVTDFARKIPCWRLPKSYLNRIGAKPLSVTSNFIKRVVGLPGDTVVIHISELHEMMRPSLRPKCDNQGNLVWHIPPGHCFVRGDAPPGSDSVTWGPIPLDTLTGVVLAKLPRRADSDQVACS